MAGEPSKDVYRCPNRRGSAETSHSPEVTSILSRTESLEHDRGFGQRYKPAGGHQSWRTSQQDRPRQADSADSWRAREPKSSTRDEDEIPWNTERPRPSRNEGLSSSTYQQAARTSQPRWQGKGEDWKLSTQRERSFRNQPGPGGDRQYTRFREISLISVSKLQEFLTQDPDEVIMGFHESGTELGKVLSSELKSKEALHLFVQVLGQKICGVSGLDSVRNSLVAKICTSTFISQLRNLTFELADIQSESNAAQLFTDLYSFYRFVSDKMPNLSADYILPLVTVGSLIITQIQMEAEDSSVSLNELGVKYKALKRQMEEFKSKRAEDLKGSVKGRDIGEFERRWLQPPPEDFRSLPLIPSVSELCSSSRPFLRPSLSRGKYPTVNDYLDVHYRLLREDFVDPLREGIKQFNKIRDSYQRPAPGTVKIYRRVQILPGLSFGTGSPAYTLKLEMTSYLRKVKWGQSKRLLPGSLLLLTQDDCTSIFFATVCRRNKDELAENGTFSISWEGIKPDFQPSSFFDMLECDVYFETYRHTLRALTELNEENFPLEKYIIQASAAQTPPPYLCAIDEPLDFKILMTNSDTAGNNASDYGLAELLDTSAWPSAIELGMDNSQYESFQAALTQEFSIIQGPPGTGKTFIGIQIAKFLLANKQHFFPRTETILDEYDVKREARIIGSPVLVVCYTNHALDQFLEAICLVMESLGLKPEDELIRVGGQTKSKAMEDLVMFRRLAEAVNSGNLPSRYLSNYSTSDRNLKKIKSRRFFLLELVHSLTDLKGVVDFYELFFTCEDYGFLDTEDNRISLIRMDPLVQEVVYALGTCKVPWKAFGLEHRAYSAVDFRPFQRLGALFNVEVKETPSVPHQRVEAAAVVDEEAAEKEDEENYDMAELMANRIEELEYESSHENETRNPNSIPYLIGPNHFEDVLSFNRQEVVDYKKMLQEDLPFERLFVVKDAIEFAEAQIVRYENIRLVFRQILSKQKDHQLQLPPVTKEMLKASIGRFKSRRRVTTCNDVRENWAVYFYCVEKLRSFVLREIPDLEQLLVDQSKKFKEIENYGYSLLLKKVKFVGATTTGAAKYNSILRTIKSKMVIVEEAAEVLESHIVTSITDHCEHLVLIGDHFQLRPKTTVYRLGKDFNLDVSLFERMINNHMNAHMLKIQHRMRPEICDLLVPTIYDSLENHESVLDYPNVRGIASNLFFIKHTEAESSEADGTSRSNEHEAMFLVQLCRHFILQGYSHEKITILTTYVGQMFLIKQIIRETICAGVRVTAVDNYQGEENDIILLSLVRSNEDNQIGFLKTDNRVCVAISRAKHGFYVIGNMDSMEASSSTWKEIVKKLTARNQIGTHLPLKCPVHGDITLVAIAADFHKAPEGGCSRMCEVVLACTHQCRLICHAQDVDHVEYKCRESCKRNCSKNGHACVGDCCEDPCPTCYVKVETLLGCGHTVDLRCHVDAGRYECLVGVTRQLACAHELTMSCFKDPTKVSCMETVTKTLPCTHEQQASCYELVENIGCLTLVKVTLPDCKHDITLPCHLAQKPSENWECELPCDTRLDCGHSCVRKCHFKNDPEHEFYKCNKDCSRTCPNDHPCMEEYEFKHKCHSKCPPCMVSMEVQLPCEHGVMLTCFASREEPEMAEFRCEEAVTRLLPCEHTSSKKCFETWEPCKVEVVKPSVDCDHEVLVPCSGTAKRKYCQVKVEPKVDSACGHPVKVPCAIQDTATPVDCMAYCETPCGQLLVLDGVGCEHECSGTCSSCFNGRIHAKCQKECGRVLICGHVCKFPCSTLCPPCDNECSMRCEHSSCKRSCGNPCETCKEPCSWKCEHARCTKVCGDLCNREPCEHPCTIMLPCNHPCVGLCNEPCPPLCAVCDKEQLTEPFFGDEDKPDARFIVLQDCGHCFEADALDKWMNMKSETKEEATGILVRRCPRCKTVVANSRRYGGILKSCMKDVTKVKRKIFTGDLNIERRLEMFTREFALIEVEETELMFFKAFISRQIFINPEKAMTTTNYKNVGMKKVDQYKFESLVHMLIWCKASVLSKKDILPSLREDLVRRYVRFFEIVKSRTLPLSKLEITQFNSEFRRLTHLYRLYLRGSMPLAQQPAILPIYQKVKDILDTFMPYTLTSLEFAGIRAELDELLGAKFLDRQVLWRVSFGAISATATSWYRCSCGEVYAVGDCGQLNESGKCPTCKSQIGRGSSNARVADAHQLPDVSMLGNIL